MTPVVTLVETSVETPVVMPVDTPVVWLADNTGLTGRGEAITKCPGESDTRGIV